MAGMVWETSRQYRKFYAGSVAIIFYYLLVWEKEWYMFPIIFLSVLLWKQYFFSKSIWEEDYQEKRQFQEFLESFQFFYQTRQTIESALEQLSEQYPSVKKLSVYRKLAGERVQKEARTEDIHIRIFFLLLEFYAEYGKETFFLKGIGFIKECVEEEILLIQKRSQLFSGAFFLMIGSLLTIKPIEAWAKQNVEELTLYYAGIRGKLTQFLCLGMIFLTTRAFIWLCFEQRIGKKGKTEDWLKEGKKQVSKKNQRFWKRKKTREIQVGKNNVNGLFRLIQMLKKKRKTEKNQPAGLVERFYGTEWIRRILKRYIRLFHRHYEWLYSFIRYVGYDGDCLKFLLTQIVRTGICIGFFLILEGSISIRFAGFWILFFAVSVFVWFSPYLKLLLCWYQLSFVKEQEILYLQTILLAAQEVEEISAEELNSWLIRVSDYYQKVFLSISGRLEFIKEEEVLQQSGGKKDVFYHMLEGLIRGRDFGWKSVFSGMEGEQIFLKKRNYQKREKRLENEGSFGRFLSMAPAVFIVLSWLILPFVTEGLAQLAHYALGMQEW